MSVTYREFLCTHLRFRHLVLAAERHQHRGGADSGVEHLDETFLGSHVRVDEAVQPLLLHCFALNISGFHHTVRHGGNLGGHFLAHAVGVDEIAAEINDGLATPRHRQAVVVRNLGDDVGLQVLLAAVLEEGFHILGRNHHAHTLLRFADGNLRAVQTLILRADRVQIDGQPVGQFADSHTHAARAKVVGLLDELGHLGTAEQMLDLALLWGVTLLHLGSAGVQ